METRPVRTNLLRAPSTANQSTLRSQNLAVVTRSIFAADMAPSRADLAVLTGLTRSTVSRLVDELLEHRVVAELDRVFDGTPGRPAVPLVPASDSFGGLGLEVNVRHAAACLTDLSGRVIGERDVSRDLAGSDPDDVLRFAASLGRELLEQAPPRLRLAGVHLALPGLVDAHEGVLLNAPNLGWRDVRPTPLVREVLGRPDAEITLGNEADCAAVSMMWSAPGQPSEHPDFLIVSGEVGIGSALVRAGEIITGRHGWAGEIGHVCVDPSGPLCACGATGCLERYVGQQALLESSGAETPEMLRAALEAGDPRALAAVEEAAHHLGIVLAGALNLLDVSTVALSGHLATISDFLMDGILTELRTRVIGAPFAPPVVISSRHNSGTIVRGASWFSLSGLIGDPAGWLESH